MYWSSLEVTTTWDTCLSFITSVFNIISDHNIFQDTTDQGLKHQALSIYQHMLLHHLEELTCKVTKNNMRIKIWAPDLGFHESLCPCLYFSNWHYLVTRKIERKTEARIVITTDKDNIRLHVRGPIILKPILVIITWSDQQYISFSPLIGCWSITEVPLNLLSWMSMLVRIYNFGPCYSKHN